MNLDSLVDIGPVQGEPLSYRPDPEKVRAGDPQQRVWSAYESPCQQFGAGIWEGEPGRWTVAYSEHEYCEILSGESLLRDAAGGERLLRAGDRFVIPAGFRGEWEVLSTCRKVYVVFEKND